MRKQLRKLSPMEAAAQSIEPFVAQGLDVHARIVAGYALRPVEVARQPLESMHTSPLDMENPDVVKALAAVEAAFESAGSTTAV